MGPKTRSGRGSEDKYLTVAGNRIPVVQFIHISWYSGSCLTLLRRHETYWGSSGTGPRILELATRQR
jgi:hypothetical protein